MSKTLQLNHVPARVTKQNIATIINTMDVYDKRADRSHQKGDFQRAMEYATYVQRLDELVANYGGDIPTNAWEGVL